MIHALPSGGGGGRSFRARPVAVGVILGFALVGVIVGALLAGGPNRAHPIAGPSSSSSRWAPRRTVRPYSTSGSFDYGDYHVDFTVDANTGTATATKNDGNVYTAKYTRNTVNTFEFTNSNGDKLTATYDSDQRKVVVTTPDKQFNFDVALDSNNNPVVHLPDAANDVTVPPGATNIDVSNPPDVPTVDDLLGQVPSKWKPDSLPADIELPGGETVTLDKEDNGDNGVAIVVYRTNGDIYRAFFPPADSDPLKVILLIPNSDQITITVPRNAGDDLTIEQDGNKWTITTPTESDVPDTITVPDVIPKPPENLPQPPSDINPPSNLPDIPEIPNLPDINLPSGGNAPNIPTPNTPSVPNVPNIPDIPQIPNSPFQAKRRL